MARPRLNKNDSWMPPRVYRGKSAFEFHPKNGGSIRLCELSASQAQVWKEYEKAINEQPSKGLVAALVEDFFHSADFYELAAETQKDYKKYSKKIVAVFGEMPADSVKPEHVRKYMDKRGVKSRTQANREKAFLSRVYRWAFERGMVKQNPAKGVRQFKETARDRYVTDDEYNALYSVAPPVVQIAMELAYLCCARQADVLNMKKNQFMNEGIFIRQSKTGVSQIKAWSDRLLAAITLANNLPLTGGMNSIYLIHQANGAKYTRDGFNSRWSRARQDAQKKYPDMKFDFTFHDLKAKGISDLDGNLYEKQAISGHKNVTQTARYNRKIAVVPVVGGQKSNK